LAKAAKLFGNNEDYKKYSALAQKIQQSFNAKYLDTATCIYGTGLQTEMSVALYWGLVPQAYKAKVAANLSKRVTADGVKLDVGLLGTKAILNALSENGYADLAYQLAARETFPSWGWWIANGATTLYENWPIDAASDISMNHIMFGEIGAWMYKAMGGIKPDAQQPGFKNVLLQPYFVKGLDHFTATHKGPYGEISSAWKRTDSGIIYSVIIPANSSATVHLAFANNQQLFKDGKLQTGVGDAYTTTLQAGTYQFKLTEKK
jgi:alpha-L-rhamnosidase